jgi:hypothetical protein
MVLAALGVAAMADEAAATKNERPPISKTTKVPFLARMEVYDAALDQSWVIWSVLSFKRSFFEHILALAEDLSALESHHEVKVHALTFDPQKHLVAHALLHPNHKDDKATNKLEDIYAAQMSFLRTEQALSPQRTKDWAEGMQSLITEMRRCLVSRTYFDIEKTETENLARPDVTLFVKASSTFTLLRGVSSLHFELDTDDSEGNSRTFEYLLYFNEIVCLARLVGLIEGEAS